jgi:hypothetical protein
MVPAELVARAITMIANPLPQPLHFGDELVTRHAFKISVHRASVSTLECLTMASQAESP